MNKAKLKVAALREAWRKHPPESTAAHHPASTKDQLQDARGLLQRRLALSVSEVAKLLSISTSAVRHMIARGELPGKKVGGGIERVTYIVPTGALMAWLDGSGLASSEDAA